jgi:hypothetical protein
MQRDKIKGELGAFQIKTTQFHFVEYGELDFEPFFGVFMVDNQTA